MHFWAVLPQKSPCWGGTGLSEDSGTRLLFLKMNNQAVDRQCIHMRSPCPSKLDDLLTKPFPSPLGGANLSGSVELTVWRSLGSVIVAAGWNDKNSFPRVGMTLTHPTTFPPSHFLQRRDRQWRFVQTLIEELFFMFPAWFSRSAESSQDVSFILPGDEKMTTSFLRMIFHLIRFFFHSVLCFSLSADSPSLSCPSSRSAASCWDFHLKRTVGVWNALTSDLSAASSPSPSLSPLIVPFTVVSFSQGSHHDNIQSDLSKKLVLVGKIPQFLIFRLFWMKSHIRHVKMLLKALRVPFSKGRGVILRPVCCKITEKFEHKYTVWGCLSRKMTFLHVGKKTQLLGWAEFLAVLSFVYKSTIILNPNRK